MKHEKMYFNSFLVQHISRMRQDGIQQATQPALEIIQQIVLSYLKLGIYTHYWFALEQDVQDSLSDTVRPRRVHKFLSKHVLKVPFKIFHMTV